MGATLEGTAAVGDAPAVRKRGRYVFPRGKSVAVAGPYIAVTFGVAGCTLIQKAVTGAAAGGTAG
jgi:hypothetical protein